MKNGSLEQMVKEFNDGTYDLTDNGKCIGCGECCSNFLPMTDKEIEIIRKYIKANKIKEHRHFLPLAVPAIDMTCPFLDNTKKCDKCTIYEVRPTICRNFICRPSERKPLDIEYGLKARCVDVRVTFFGKGGSR